MRAGRAASASLQRSVRMQLPFQKGLLRRTKERSLADFRPNVLHDLPLKVATRDWMWLKIHDVSPRTLVEPCFDEGGWHSALSQQKWYRWRARGSHGQDRELKLLTTQTISTSTCMQMQVVMLTQVFFCAVFLRHECSSMPKGGACGDFHAVYKLDSMLLAA